jgi:hypothetical protein
MKGNRYRYFFAAVMVLDHLTTCKKGYFLIFACRIQTSHSSFIDGGDLRLKQPYNPNPICRSGPSN